MAYGLRLHGKNPASLFQDLKIRAIPANELIASPWCSHSESKHESDENDGKLDAHKSCDAQFRVHPVAGRPFEEYSTC